MQVVIELLKVLDAINIDTMFFILALSALGLAALSISEFGKKGRH